MMSVKKGDRVSYKDTGEDTLKYGVVTQFHWKMNLITLIPETEYGHGNYIVNGNHCIYLDNIEEKCSILTINEGLFDI